MDNSHPQVRIKRINKTLPIPSYKTKGSIGFDLYSRVDITIQPQTIERVPANVVVETPPGYLLMLASRSSTPSKKGLTKPHGVGIIDQDYSGDNDELLIQLYNFTDKPSNISKGERIAQAIFIKADRLAFQEVEQMDNKNRGGFGSTDSKSS